MARKGTLRNHSLWQNVGDPTVVPYVLLWETDDPEAPWAFINAEDGKWILGTQYSDAKRFLVERGWKQLWP